MIRVDCIAKNNLTTHIADSRFRWNDEVVLVFLKVNACHRLSEAKDLLLCMYIPKESRFLRLVADQMGGTGWTPSRATLVFQLEHDGCTR